MDAEGQVQSTMGPELCPGEQGRGHHGDLMPGFFLVAFTLSLGRVSSLRPGIQGVAQGDEDSLTLSQG